MLVHVIRLDFFNSNQYRGDVLSTVDVVRDVDKHIRAELSVKKCQFLAMEGFFTLHEDACKYDMRFSKMLRLA